MVLFSQLSMSKILIVRIFGAKLLFTLLKHMKPSLVENRYKEEVLETVIKSVLSLMKERAKVLKKHGLKLSSLIQVQGNPKMSK